MASDAPDTIAIVLATSFGKDSWDISLPVDFPIALIIKKLIENQELPFREQDDSGIRIPYRIMWKERGRYLIEGETLRGAQVDAGHTLVMSHEPRAGMRV